MERTIWTWRRTYLAPAEHEWERERERGAHRAHRDERARREEHLADFVSEEDFGQPRRSTAQYGASWMGFRGADTSDAAALASMAGERAALVPRRRAARLGRGPKSYKRSNERIREDICDVLTWDCDVDATDIEVAVVGGEVTLTGDVGSRAEKHIAEDISTDVSGVTGVHNRLKVRRS